ncbi:MAG TPA: carbonic anhydrase [Candidatus Limnocylindrales bacterium]|nr:carbonic anhydrase [Candidatus Limnocylindrales bacterium]
MNDIIERLLQGNRRFSLGEALRSDISIARRYQLSVSQQPFAMILGCSDSRVPPEIVFDCGLGDLFVIRTAGHTIDKVVMESILFGIKSLYIPLIVVLGHARCGAVSLVIQKRQQLGNADDASCITEQIALAIEQHGNIPQYKNEDDLLNSIVKTHVKMTLARIENLIMPISKDVNVLGAYYDLNTGIVEVISRPTRACT